jgi:hypothetical protein
LLQCTVMKGAFAFAVGVSCVMICITSHILFGLNFLWL